jgi:hypothetical protein
MFLYKNAKSVRIFVALAVFEFEIEAAFYLMGMIVIAIVIAMVKLSK